MIKQLGLKIIEMLLQALILVLLCLLILLKINHSFSYYFYAFFSKQQIVKQEALIQTYSDISHPNCHLTKEVDCFKQK